MDVRMPVMDGLEATRRIKTTEAGKAISVVALSASALDDEKEAILAAGCDGFVRKPYREAEIFEVMAHHLGLKYIYENETVAEVLSESNVEANLEQVVAALNKDLRQELYESVLRLNTDQRCFRGRSFKTTGG
jgi:CheY-like chemotaxis protein